MIPIPKYKKILANERLSKMRSLRERITASERTPLLDDIYDEFRNLEDFIKTLSKQKKKSIFEGC